MNSKLVWVLFFVFAALVANNVYSLVLVKEATDRTAQANQQIIELAKCQSEQRLCAWSTK